MPGTKRRTVPKVAGMLAHALPLTLANEEQRRLQEAMAAVLRARGLKEPLRDAAVRTLLAESGRARWEAIGELLAITEKRYTGGRPRVKDREGAKKAYREYRRENVPPDGAVALIQGEFGVARSTVYEWRRLNRWDDDVR